MEFLTELWLPIVLAAVFVFIASSVIHMALPIHKSDVKRIKNEDQILESMRANGVEPGNYMFPCADSMKDMGTPEMQAKMKQGPVGWLTVLPPGGFNIGKSLVWWFVFTLIVGLFVAYVSWHALDAGAAFRHVFRIAGTAGILGYAMGHINECIWKGVSWTATAKFFFDGVVYALVTGATFAWLWPDVG